MKSLCHSSRSQREKENGIFLEFPAEIQISRQNRNGYFSSQHDDGRAAGSKMRYYFFFFRGG
jgi:hypothetical protein